jgi:hypothetical protein
LKLLLIPFDIVEPSLKLLQSLLTTMQSKPLTWLSQFIEAEGIAALTSLLSNLMNTHKYALVSFSSEVFRFLSKSLPQQIKE